MDTVQHDGSCIALLGVGLGHVDAVSAHGGGAFGDGDGSERAPTRAGEAVDLGRSGNYSKKMRRAE